MVNKIVLLKLLFMPRYSELQKKIALCLLEKPACLEELSKRLKLPNDELHKELKEMVKLNVVEAKGYPQAYHLQENIVSTLKERKRLEETDNFTLRLKITIEAQAIEEELLKKEMKRIENLLRQDKEFTVYDSRLAEPIKQENHYTSFLEANLSVKDFKALVKLIFYFGPTSMEIIKPEKIAFSAHDLQDGLLDMAELVHTYTEYITQTMKREEIEQFHKKLYSTKE